MSYNVWLEIDTGGPAPATLSHILSVKCTSNVSFIWKEAGLDLRKFNNMNAGEVTPLIYRAIVYIRNPENFKDFQSRKPSEGRGTVEDCLEFLVEIERACRNHPRAVLRIWS